jgi:hypothetical protein
MRSSTSAHRRHGTNLRLLFCQKDVNLARAKKLYPLEQIADGELERASEGLDYP